MQTFHTPQQVGGASPGASDLGKDEHKEVGCSRQYVLVTARLTAVLFLAQANRCRSKSRCHAEILHDPAGSTDRFLGCSVAGGEAPASRRRSRSQFRWWQSPLAPSAEMAPSEILLILLESERKQQSWVVLFQCLGDLPEALAQACVKLAHLELHGLALSLSTEQLLVK